MIFLTIILILVLCTYYYFCIFLSYNHAAVVNEISSYLFDQLNGEVLNGSHFIADGGSGSAAVPHICS